MLAGRRRDLLCAVAPLDEHVYAIELIHVEHDETGTFSRGRSDALRGWFTEIKGEQFVTLEPLIHVVDEALPAEHRDMLYVVAKVTRQGNEVSIAPINPQEGEELKTSEDLAKLVAERGDDPELYIEPVTARRLDFSKEADRAYLALLSNPWLSN
jgi:hypothetical protein